MLETLLVLMFLGLLAFIALGVEDKRSSAIAPRLLSVTTDDGPTLPGESNRK